MKRVPQFDFTIGLVLLLFGVLCLTQRFDDPYEIAFVFGMYFGFTVGGVLLKIGIEGLVEESKEMVRE